MPSAAAALSKLPIRWCCNARIATKTLPMAASTASASGSRSIFEALMTRRTFLAVSATALQARERVRREVFLHSPGPGTAVMCDAYYTKASGGSMMSIEHRFSRSDTVDVAYYRYSKDHGKTWSAPVERRTGEKRPEGMWRRHPRACFVDPHTGRFLEFW